MAREMSSRSRLKMLCAVGGAEKTNTRDRVGVKALGKHGVTGMTYGTLRKVWHLQG